MNSKERFYSAMQYKGYDRPPTTYHGTPETDAALMDYFGVEKTEEVLGIIGDDFRSVEPPFIGPDCISVDYYGEKEKKNEDGTWEGIWGEHYKLIDFGTGAYPEATYLPFKDITEVEELEKIRFPSPEWFDYSNIKSECEKFKDYVIVTGNAGVPDFMNGIARCRGVEQVLLNVALEDPVFLKLMEIRFNFFYKMYERILKAGDGAIDILYLGEDYGNQNGLMISPTSFDRLFAPYMEKMFALGHRYGAKTMMHCCGSCRDLIPRFIELGLDILEVVQTDAAKMDIEGLHRDFYSRIAFCGSISVQSILPFGSEEDVIREVELRKRLFKDGGMIIAPTHQIQAGTPVKNILAMYRTIGSLKERMKT